MTDRVPGAFCFVLHSHLPWLPGHGAWPDGEEWLHQAFATSYVPLVAELDALAEEGHRDVLTLGISPVLAAQLDHPQVLEDTATWVGLWEMRTRDAAAGDGERRGVAEHDGVQARRAAELLATRWAGGGSPVLRSLRENGTVELLGGPAAHPFLPLLLPEVAAAALSVGLEDSTWRLGARPRGIWAPECAFSPWLGEVFDRHDVGHFLVDGQAVRDAGGHPNAAWRVAGHDVVAVPHDLETSNFVWSSRAADAGGSPSCRFHAGEHDLTTGLRLWARTGPDAGTVGEQPYDPDEAQTQVARDVEHFVDAVRRRLLDIAERQGSPGLVVAAYDTELFGHGWHEGPRFLGQAVRALREAGVTVSTVAQAVDGGHVAGELELGDSSGAPGNDFSVWNGQPVRVLAQENYWLQRRWVDLLARARSRDDLRLRRPELDQLLRTLFNALSSDWAFLITCGRSVDYAHRRAEQHRRDFHVLAQMVEDGRRQDSLAEAARQARTDQAFPTLDARVVSATSS